MTRWRYVPRRLRYRLARWLDKRHPSACWARLAMWAWWPANEESLTDALQPGESCVSECAELGSCYCGKREVSPVKIWCYITRQVDGSIYIDSSYDADFVADLNRLVPAADRRWDDEETGWWVNTQYAATAEALARRYYGEVTEV